MNVYEVRSLVVLMATLTDYAKSRHIQRERFTDPVGVFFVLFDGYDSDYCPAFRGDFSVPNTKIYLRYKGNIPEALAKRMFPLARKEDWEALCERVMKNYFGQNFGIGFAMEKVS